MLLFSRATNAILVSLFLPIYAQPALAQPAQPPAELSRFEIGAYVSFKQTNMQPDGGTWTGPGLSVEVNANVSKRYAVASRVETYSDGRIAAALAGAQVSTPFHYANKRDSFPGRFFAKALAGAARDSFGVTRPALYIGTGADGILFGRRGIGLHWDVGWEVVPGDPRRRVRGRVGIGLIVGPHVRRNPGDAKHRGSARGSPIGHAHHIRTALVHHRMRRKRWQRAE